MEWAWITAAVLTGICLGVLLWLHVTARHEDEHVSLVEPPAQKPVVPVLKPADIEPTAFNHPVWPSASPTSTHLVAHVTRIWLALLLLLLAVPAAATGPVLNHCSFTWVDASVVADAITSFNVYVGPTATGPFPTKIGSIPATTSVNYGPTANFCAGLPDGQYFAVVTAVNLNQESEPSESVPFALLTRKPNAPSALTVR